jgi:hypothetical protein
MKKVFCNIIFLTICTLSLYAQLASAAENAANVVALRGEVSAETSGVTRTLGQGDSIAVEDQVMTGDKSFAVLQFIDGAKVTVRPNSALVIEEYIYSGDDKDTARLSLVAGGLRVITGAMAKTHPENYKVKTPVALMGVRGTEFSIMLCGEGVCDEEGNELETEEE